MSIPTIRKQKIVKNHWKTRLILFGILAVLLILTALFSEQLCPYDPYLQNLANAKAAPSADHIFGTDRYGRDMLSRVIAGSRTSIFSSLILVAVITIFGTVVGVFCGWKGGWVDSMIMRISDIFLAFPGLVFALAAAAVLAAGFKMRCWRWRRSAGRNMPGLRAGRPWRRRKRHIFRRHGCPAAIPGRSSGGTFCRISQERFL